jgi:hypothetical protein
MHPQRKRDRARIYGGQVAKPLSPPPASRMRANAGRVSTSKIRKIRCGPPARGTAAVIAVWSSPLRVHFPQAGTACSNRSSAVTRGISLPCIRMRPRCRILPDNLDRRRTDGAKQICGRCITDNAGCVSEALADRRSRVGEGDGAHPDGLRRAQIREFYAGQRRRATFEVENRPARALPSLLDETGDGPVDSFEAITAGGIADARPRALQ